MLELCSRAYSDGALLERLRRLEAAVNALDVEEKVPNASITGHADGSSPSVNEQGPEKSNALDDVPYELGRLVVDEGRSRYVSKSFWANITGEAGHILLTTVEDIKAMLDEDTDDEDDNSPPNSHSGRTSHAHQQGFVFGFTPIIDNLNQLYPDVSHTSYLWQLYVSNVDPLLKLLYKPTIEKLIATTNENLEGLTASNAAILFSVFFAAVISLSDEECVTMMGESKVVLHDRYRFAIEQALARAGFLTSQELLILQAFVLYLICVRRHEQPRLIWTLTGLCIRIANALGLHRDGDSFGLSPFETEMRRRLWGHICVLDIRAAEDYGTDSSITATSYDTKLPLNINDSDLNPNSIERPVNRQGATDMIFCIITVEDREKAVEECRKYVEEKYLKYCDTTDPLAWLTITVARLIFAKVWLILASPFQADRVALAPETTQRLFISAIEVIEYSKLVVRSQATRHWSWLSRGFIQWHAVAFILAVLCERTIGDIVDRAWVAVQDVFDELDLQAGNSSKSLLWRSLLKLKGKASHARELELAREQCITNLGGAPNNITGQPTASTNGTTLPIDSTGLPSQSSVEPGGAMTTNQSEEPLFSGTGLDQTLLDVHDTGNWETFLREFQMEVDKSHGYEQDSSLDDMRSWW
ncbi:MAG: hypothetical protein M1833_002774 [Piccolia ochrophora]|nr:MAG: hypothetical protein M1833_002774 [Piccolia ochrophora]